jgi:bacteriorhodopsin
MITNVASKKNKIMNDKDLDKIISDYFENEIKIPERLSERIENRINTKIKESGIRNRKHFKWINIAASVLLCTGLFFTVYYKSNHSFPDTFQDPAEAATCAEQTLAFVSTTLNLGLSSVETTKDYIENTNKILNNNLTFK